MKARFVHKWVKPMFIKQIAMLMCICYLLNPMYHQVNNLLHTISHGLEIPDVVLSHQARASDAHNYSHGYHEHGISEVQHKHSFIDFVNAIFEALNTEDQSSDTSIKDKKIDKHIATQQYHLHKLITINVDVVFWEFVRKSHVGYQYTTDRPPENF